MNRNAQRLGRMAKGRKKTLTEEQKRKRGELGRLAFLAYHAKRKAQLNLPTH